MRECQDARVSGTVLAIEFVQKRFLAPSGPSGTLGPLHPRALPTATVLIPFEAAASREKFIAALSRQTGSGYRFQFPALGDMAF